MVPGRKGQDRDVSPVLDLQASASRHNAFIQILLLRVE